MFHHLRNSRQTELATTFPAPVACDWLGNSEAVAMKHYVRTTYKHFGRAVGRTPKPKLVPIYPRRPKCGSTRPETWLSAARYSSHATLISSSRCLKVIDTFRPPTCTVEAASSKRRKRDVQPLPDAIVPLIRSWLVSQTPRRPIFKSIAGDTARMLRSDLAAARQAWIGEAKQDEAETVRRQESDFLAYRDQHGRVADFHSLRVVFISRVVAGGASVREAQTLARHSTPNLTMNVYSQASLLEVTGAVNGLGDLLSTAPAPELLPEGNVRASGTGETPSGGPCPAGKIDPLIDPSERAPGGTRRHSGGDIGVVSGPLTAPSAQQKTPAKPGNSGTSQGSMAERLRSESNRRWRICIALFVWVICIK